MAITFLPHGSPGFNKDAPPQSSVTQQAPVTQPNSPLPTVITGVTHSPQGPTTTTDSDQLSHLLQVRYAGLYFPTVSFTENSSQDIAIHKYPNIDGARLEPTGRNPSTYTCRGIFSNNIYPSINESWQQGTLFPNVFEQVLNVLYDSTTYHTLQHPFLGFRDVIPANWTYSFIGKGPRDGVFLDISFIETNQGLLDDSNASHTSLLSQNTAESIDIAIASTSLTKMNPPNLSLGQLFSKISGIVKNTMSLPQQIVAPLNAQLMQVNAGVQGIAASIINAPTQLNQYGTSIVNQNKGLILHGPISNSYFYNRSNSEQQFNINQAALTRVYNTVTAMNSNTSNTAINNVNNVIAFTSAMINYYQSLSRAETATVVFLLNKFLGQLQQVLATMSSSSYSINNNISTYEVKNPTTIFSLSKILNNTTSQLLKLNLGLNKLYIVPDATIIKYYRG